MSKNTSRGKTESVSGDSGSPHGTLKTGSQGALKNLFASTSSQMKKSKQDQLQELLHKYSNGSLPPFPTLLNPGRKSVNPQLEGHWTTIVENTEDTNIRRQQEAVWELIETEVTYLKNLDVIMNVFMACFYDLQQNQLLNDVDTDKVFSNLFDIHQANCTFWEEHMSLILDKARETKQPLNAHLLLDGFKNFDVYFQPYTKFCMEYLACREYVTKQLEENDLFKKFVIWAENHPQCNRLGLKDFFIKPFQRLTKYKLLWERISKYEPPPGNSDMQIAIATVDKFVASVDARLKQREIMSRIEAKGYDGVEVPNNEVCVRMVSAYSQLDLARPMPGCNVKEVRCPIMEGMLKFQGAREDKTSRPQDTYCFLFTDMFLMTKQIQSKKQDPKSKVRVLKPPMRLDKVIVDAITDGFAFVYLNEYNMAVSAYTFQGENAKEWLERVKETQEKYRRLRTSNLSQSESHMDFMPNGYDLEDESASLNSDQRSGLPDYEAAVAGNCARRQNSTVFFMPPDNRSRSSTSTSEQDPVEPRHQRTLMALPNASLSLNHSPARTPPHSPSVKHPSLGTSLSVDASTLLVAAQRTGPEVFQRYSSVTSSTASSLGQDGSLENLDLSTEDVSSVNPRLSNYNQSETQRKIHKIRHQKGDKRFITADMINCDRPEKDASIQKRLSWHCGTKAADYGDKGGLKSKTFSSDSLRSVHSSSGVSSGGYLSPGNDICEEDLEQVDNNGNHGNTFTSSSSSSSSHTDYQALHDHHHHQQQQQQQQRHLSLQSQSSQSSNDSVVQLSLTRGSVTEESSMQDGDAALSSSLGGQNKSVSKSLPNIAQIGLLDSAAAEAQRRKLSPYQMKKINKKMLLNSTLEATDV